MLCAIEGMFLISVTIATAATSHCGSRPASTAGTVSNPVEYHGSKRQITFCRPAFVVTKRREGQPQFRLKYIFLLLNTHTVDDIF